MHTFRRTLFVSGWILLGAAALAQTKGTISGFTKDPSGASVPGVSVTVTNEGTGAVRNATSDETGFYQVLALVSGTYRIEAQASGFKRYRNSGVVLRVDENVRADVLLELGEVSESVEVRAVAAQIDTRSSETSATIDDRRIVDLPLSGRNVFALAATLPGVLNVGAPDNTAVGDARTGPQMNVNGGRRNMNYHRFNGAYFMNPSRNTGLNVPPPDAIQEFKIQTSNFAADSGRNPGANVTIVSKQGTNAFHGAGWGFMRNDNLNARSFFQPRKPELKQAQYGASAGGPIRQDKIFYFGTVELSDDRSQATSTTALPPSRPELAGDFSHLNGRKTLRNPRDNTVLPNNQLPRSQFDPAAQTVLGFVPAVDRPDTTIQAFGSVPRDAELYMGRFDANLTSKQTLFGNYYYNQNRISSDGLAYGSNIAGWTGQSQRTRVQTAAINHVYTVSPTTLNQLTLGYTRSYSLSTPTVTRLPSELGIQGMPQYTDGGSVRFSVTGRITLGSGGPVKFISNNYQVQDHVSLIRGRHTLKFGFEYLDVGFFQSFLGPPQFSFNGQRTGNGSAPAGDSMADFLLGAYQQIPVSNGIRVNDIGNTFTALFFHDDFKVSPRLTLNFGLRYELPTPWVHKQDAINTLSADPSVRSKKFPNAPPAMLFPGDLPRGLYKTDRNNFAPRFGFAWDVFGDGRTAVRAAWGLFYDTFNADTLAQTNPPFNGGSRTFVNGQLSDPFGSIGAVAPPAFIDPNAFTFVFPLNGLWGPIGQDHLRTTYVQEWNLILQRELGRTYALSTGYIAKTGRKLIAFRPFNAAPYIPGTNAAGQPISTLANAGTRVPFLPGIYGPSGLYLDNPFTSNYHSLQIELTKRFSRGLQFNTSYVLSKSLDSSSTDNLGGCLVNPFDVRHDKGRSSWDRRHAWVASGVWSPYEKQQGALGRLLGGWSLSGISRVQSGVGLSVSSGQDTALNGSGCSTRADIIGNPTRDHASRNDMINQFFNVAAFRQPAVGTYGTAGRSVFSGPAFVSTELAILKDVVVREDYRFQVRGEFFNAFNQVNLSNPVTSLTSATIGRIQGAGSGRTVQLGIKFLW